MRQLSVLLALSSPRLHALMRTEVMAEPELVLVGDASTPHQAVVQTRRFEPQVVLCDEHMLADGQMAAISQQALVVSLLVLVTPDDGAWFPRLPVPVAGTVSAHHPPGALIKKLRAIVAAPAAFVESGALAEKWDTPLGKAQAPKSLDYDAKALPLYAYDPSALPLYAYDPGALPPSAHDPSRPQAFADVGALVAPFVQDPMASPLMKRVLLDTGKA